MRSTIFSIDSDSKFEEAALSVFNFQYQHNSVYRRYVDYLGKDHQAIQDYREIPFLPIELFKSQLVYTAANDPVLLFSSSGTTGDNISKHHVADLAWYEDSFRMAFQQFYGSPKDIAILALLPSYSEREGSSLIYMVDDLIAQSGQPESGYFLYNHEELHAVLMQLKNKGTKTLLIGVTYALLDFSDHYQIDFPELIVMETGGMKGRRKEMIREELHSVLCHTFNVQHIHSEYGMTELLSQAYSTGLGRFKTPGWMQVHIRDTNDPLTLIDTDKTGAINIIDLANYHSCAFIATQDLGKRYGDGSFEVLGRFDNSDIRGCNLLVQ